MFALYCVGFCYYTNPLIRYFFFTTTVYVVNNNTDNNKTQSDNKHLELRNSDSGLTFKCHGLLGSAHRHIRSQCFIKLD